MRLVFLDTGPLGVLTNPKGTPEALACQQWVRDLPAAKVRVVVPAIADYELRRELIRAGKIAGLRRLDAVPMGLEFDPITQAALDRAASNSRPVKCDSSRSSHFDSGSLTGPLPRGRRWSRRGLAEPEIARSRHSSGAFGSSSRTANATLVEPQAKSDAWFPGSNAGLRRILKDRPLWCDSTYQSHQ